MPGKVKKIAKTFFVIVSLLVVFLYLLVCLTPYVDPGRYWFIALLGLGFPLVFAALIICLLFWLIARSRWAILPIVALLLSWQQLAVVFAPRLTSSFKMEKTDSTIRVMSWNVRLWDGNHRNGKNGSARDTMIALVKQQNADILCFQEFFESKDTVRFAGNIAELERAGYPYHYYFPTYTRFNGNYSNGVAIFSRFPILDTMRISFGKKAAAENLIWADVMMHNRRVRILTTHLQSVLFNRKDFEGLNKIKTTDDSALSASRTIVSKLKRAYEYRSLQADIVHQQIEKSPYPVIVCGDFNDVPNSYSYFTIRGDLQDAFLRKGSGTGRTFRYISPTLRIDYLLIDPVFEVEQYSRIQVPYSDHYPVRTDLRFKDNP